MKKRLKFDPSDNFKYLSRRRCHEEKVEDWKWKLEVIMNITFNARQKCYYSYWAFTVGYSPLANAIAIAFYTATTQWSNLKA